MVRQRPAKPLSPGSNPGGASRKSKMADPRDQPSFFVHMEKADMITVFHNYGLGNGSHSGGVFSGSFSTLKNAGNRFHEKVLRSE